MVRPVLANIFVDGGGGVWGYMIVKFAEEVCVGVGEAAADSSCTVETVCFRVGYDDLLIMTKEGES